ncbi:MAG: hypothetical protein J3T61_00435 [Candidatus Brocadiales bacterium]|nr:hypothetical protein [Candidatus Bathyanammoxibius sp.]
MRRLFVALLLAGGFCLSVVPIFAASIQKQITLTSLGGSLNLESGDLSTPPTDYTIVENVDFQVSGILSKRPGYTKLNATAITGAPTITGLYDYRKADGSTFFIIGATDGELYKDLSGTPTSISTGHATGEANTWNFETWKDEVVMCNNATGVFAQKFDGTTVSVLGTGAGGGVAPTTCSIPKVYRSRLFIAQVDSSVLHYSAGDTLEDFTTADAGFENIGDDDGDIITGLEPFLNILVVFKRNSTYIITGGDPSTWAISKLSNNVGAACRRCVAQVPTRDGHDLIFIHESGVYSLRGVDQFGDLLPAKLSFKINSLWEGLNKGRIEHSQIVYHAPTGQVWITTTKDSTTANDIILKFYSHNVGWATMTHAAHSIGTRLDVAQDTVLYTGDTGGFVYKQHQGDNDAGAGIAGSFRTAWLHGGNPATIKKWYQLVIFYEPVGAYPLVIDYEVNGGTVSSGTLTLVAGGDVLDSTFILDTSILGGSTLHKIKFPDALGEGELVRVKISNSNADQPFRIHGLVIRYTEADR